MHNRISCLLTCVKLQPFICVKVQPYNQIFAGSLIRPGRIGVDVAGYLDDTSFGTLSSPQAFEWTGL